MNKEEKIKLYIYLILTIISWCIVYFVTISANATSNEKVLITLITSWCFSALLISMIYNR